MSRVVIFTDGASKGNPGRGGWGAIVATDKKVVELGGREAHTTNNRMELQAAYEAIACAAEMFPENITVYADSSYVISGATKWGVGWRRNGWITSTKQPVLNKDIWEPFLNLLDTLTASVEWKNVGGHIGIPGNERVDTIASNFATGEPVKLYSGAVSVYSVDISHVEYDESLKQKKSDSKTRSKAKAFSYVSEVDGDVKVHKTWGECEARVRGRSARFKKALNAQEESALVQKFSGIR